MENQIKRPVTVWVTQIVLLFVFLSTLFDIVFYTVSAEYLGFSVSRAALVVLTFFVATVVSLIAFWGLVKRRNYGRYFAMLLFGAMCAWDIYLVVSYTLAQEIPGVSFRQTIVPAVPFLFLLILILGLGFGRKTREFFDFI